jgi:hypothetical protein
MDKFKSGMQSQGDRDESESGEDDNYGQDLWALVGTKVNLWGRSCGRHARRKVFVSKVRLFVFTYSELV